MPRKNQGKMRIYWWNFKKAARKVFIWLGILFILSAGSTAFLHDVNPPEPVGAVVGVVLFAVFIWGLRASFKKDWWDSEEEIVEKKKGRSEGGWGAGNPGELDDYFYDDDW
jgi:uncharacterized membrane protein YfcA